MLCTSILSGMLSPGLCSGAWPGSECVAWDVTAAMVRMKNLSSCHVDVRSGWGSEAPGQLPEQLVMNGCQISCLHTIWSLAASAPKPKNYAGSLAAVCLLLPGCVQHDAAQIRPLQSVSAGAITQCKGLERRTQVRVLLTGEEFVLEGLLGATPPLGVKG